MFCRLAGDRPNKSHFVVKVVFELEGLKVHNEDFILCGHIIEKYSPSDVRELEVKIKEEGFNAYKGFFYAIIPSNGQKKMDGVNVVEIKINTKTMQPVEGW